MGDLGYLDDDGRLWFVRPQVATGRDRGWANPLHGALRGGFQHPSRLFFARALVGVGEGDDTRPVLCVELENDAAGDRETIAAELLAIGARFEHTRGIDTVLFHPGFPVDIRHNAKIGRGQLADWASKKLRV